MKPQTNLSRLLVSGVCFALLPLVDMSCQSNQADVAPRPTGAYLIWTAKSTAEFDQIVVKVDGNTVGTIHRPFIVTKDKPKPVCEDRGGGIVYVTLPAGDHSVDATGQLKGKPAGHWQGTLHVEADFCKRLELSDK